VLLTLIFGVLGVILVISAEGSSSVKNNPMLRVGGWFFGGALLLIALAFLIAAL
jgi:cbb3-type cytochrome oxidase subunit 1